MLKNPKHGFGSGMNPCIDCRAMMFDAAKKQMEKIGAEFIISGEVLGQRPMSQHGPAMKTIEKESGLEGKIVRPLSAGLLGKTEPELNGLIKREDLGMISGRRRIEQLKLAKEYGIEDPPNAGGPNGALPHAQVTNRKFANGDLIVVDLTLRYKGYVSDSTRTFGLGSVSEKAKSVYEIVKESQKMGLKAVKPGASCKSIDDACRKYIKNADYGKYFIHSTGHGIGLEVHELPNISPKSTTKLAKNMAITVEPGIYIPKKFGVRIEDSLIVQGKPIVMHKFTKEFWTRY